MLADVKVQTVYDSAQESLHRPQIQLGFFDISAYLLAKPAMNYELIAEEMPI